MSFEMTVLMRYTFIELYLLFYYFNNYIYYFISTYILSEANNAYIWCTSEMCNLLNTCPFCLCTAHDLDF